MHNQFVTPDMFTRSEETTRTVRSAPERLRFAIPALPRPHEAAAHAAAMRDARTAKPAPKPAHKPGGMRALLGRRFNPRPAM